MRLAVHVAWPTSLRLRHAQQRQTPFVAASQCAAPGLSSHKHRLQRRTVSAKSALPVLWRCLAAVRGACQARSCLQGLLRFAPCARLARQTRTRTLRHRAQPVCLAPPSSPWKAGWNAIQSPCVPPAKQNCHHQQRIETARASSVRLGRSKPRLGHSRVLPGTCALVVSLSASRRRHPAIASAQPLPCARAPSMRLRHPPRTQTVTASPSRLVNPINMR